MDKPAEYQIPHHKPFMFSPDHVENILTYVEIEDLWCRPFTKFQQLDLALRRMLPCNKFFFIGKANDCFKIEHDKVNNIPFKLNIQKLGTTCEIWENDIHIDTQKYTVQGVHSVQYDDVEDDSFLINSLPCEEKFQFCGKKYHTATTCDQFVNNIIFREIIREYPKLERQVLHNHKEMIDMGK